jgi:hypothetical protein
MSWLFEESIVTNISRFEKISQDRQIWLSLSFSSPPPPHPPPLPHNHIHNTSMQLFLNQLFKYWPNWKKVNHLLVWHHEAKSKNTYFSYFLTIYLFIYLFIYYGLCSIKAISYLYQLHTWTYHIYQCYTM